MPARRKSCTLETFHTLPSVQQPASLSHPVTTFATWDATLQIAEVPFSGDGSWHGSLLEKLKPVWDGVASDKAKMQLFKSTVETVLLYSCEALAITKTMAKNLDASHRALMRYSLCVHFPVQLSNEDLYSRTCITPATTTLLRSRLCLIGHALRRPEMPLATFVNPQNQPSEPFHQGG